MKQDKILHFLCCLAVAIAVATVMANCLAASYPTKPVVAAAMSCAAGFMAAILTGMGKEYGDYCHGSKFDRKDLMADLAGALIGSQMGWVLLLCI